MFTTLYRTFKFIERGLVYCTVFNSKNRKVVLNRKSRGKCRQSKQRREESMGCKEGSRLG